MPSWIWVALYLIIGAAFTTSFDKKEQPDYGFVTVIMLFWPVIVFVFLLITILILIKAAIDLFTRGE